MELVKFDCIEGGTVIQLMKKVTQFTHFRGKKVTISLGFVFSGLPVFIGRATRVAEKKHKCGN